MGDTNWLGASGDDALLDDFDTSMSTIRQQDNSAQKQPDSQLSGQPDNQTKENRVNNAEKQANQLAVGQPDSQTTRQTDIQNSGQLDSPTDSDQLEPTPTPHFDDSWFNDPWQLGNSTTGQLDSRTDIEPVDSTPEPLTSPIMPSSAPSTSSAMTDSPTARQPDNQTTGQPQHENTENETPIDDNWENDGWDNSSNPLEQKRASSTTVDDWSDNWDRFTASDSTQYAAVESPRRQDALTTGQPVVKQQSDDDWEEDDNWDSQTASAPDSQTSKSSTWKDADWGKWDADSRQEPQPPVELDSETTAAIPTTSSTPEPDSWDWETGTQSIPDKSTTGQLDSQTANSPAATATGQLPFDLDDADDDDTDDKPSTIRRIAFISACVLVGLALFGGIGYGAYTLTGHIAEQRAQTSAQPSESELHLTKLQRQWGDLQDKSRKLLSEIGASSVSGDKNLKTQADALQSTINGKPMNETQLKDAIGAAESQYNAVKQNYDTTLTKHVTEVGEKLKTTIIKANNLKDAPGSDDKKKMLSLADKWQNVTISKDNITEAQSALDSLNASIGKVEQAKKAKEEQERKEKEERERKEQEQREREQAERDRQAAEEAERQAQQQAQQQQQYVPQYTPTPQYTPVPQPQPTQQSQPTPQPQQPSTPQPSGNSGVHL